jgi:hypothetical protein
VLSDARYTDLRENLKHLRGRFEKAKKEQKPLKDFLENEELPAEEFGSHYRRFYRWIDQQLADIREMLDALER